MFEANPIFALLARALDTAALRQAVHSSNIANAEVPDFHRLEVSLDAPLELPDATQPLDFLQRSEVPAHSELLPGADGLDDMGAARVVSTGESVRLDQEMALMAKDALRYQALLGAFERTIGLLDLAVREGRGG